ncbi:MULTISPECIES: SDR family oxidoreductase [Actinosynnema]|uniref:SDR family oxidoreductase n=1 Tax=Actinosynnema TaxID=40566 RepID=UPI0020A550AB|nr:SDR family oxidoreductase [Actinosynnema pretiosum]MCP2096486.1 NAD(P)-dependent dehydrogenase, short-chain alcohol dehydrogenase family [Actinosynnema pretiosum]
MDDYTGRRVVVTGGGSGIGLATARLLVSAGARVLITGRDPETLESARRELGDHALTARGDTSSLADLDALAARVRDEFGEVDALFVNAGVSAFAPLEHTTEALYDELFAINAKGAYFTVQKLAPLLATGGAVVLTTSAANAIGMPGVSAYSATKAALRSMTRTLARELLPRGIRVNAVSPGPIATGILAKGLSEEQAAEVARSLTEDIPMARFGDPAEVARAVAFLAFEATYTTGAELAVDGGGTQL